MSKLSKGASRVIGAIGLAAIFLCLSVGPAFAAPSFEVKLESDPLANEVQRVTVKATAGQYRLNFGEGGPGASETADVAFNASAAEVAAALNAIANVSSGGGLVSVTGGPGDELGTKPYFVTFVSGPLRMNDIEEMSVSAGTTPLSGGSVLAAVRTTNVGGVSRGDLRTDYTVSVRNTAGTKPAIGDSLTCDAQLANWQQSPTFSFKWIRDADLANPVSESKGGTTSTYELQPGDAGHSFQCYVTGSNLGGASASFSMPMAIDPTPSPAPPTFSGSGNPRPTVAFANGGTAANHGVRTCALPTTWNGPSLGTANTTSGSNQLTNVGGASSLAVGQVVAAPGVPAGTTITAISGSTVTLSANATATATGVAVSATSAGIGTTVSGSNAITGLVTAASSGTLTSGSTAVTALGMRTSRWVIGLPVSGPGIPAGTTVTATSGTGLTLSQAATASGTGVSLVSEGPLPFSIGQEIEGPGIPAGTTVTGVSPGSLTLSAAATASASNVALAGATAGNWSFQWLRNGSPIQGATSSTYTPQVITGTANAAAGSNQLTAVATAKGSGTLSAGSNLISGLATTSGRFLVGQAISGTGIPAAATIAAVGPGTTLELSAPAEASGSQSLSAGSQPFAVGDAITGPTFTAGTGTGNTTQNSKIITGVTTSTGAFAVGQLLTATAPAVASFPPGTTIVAVGSGTLEVSLPSNGFTTSGATIEGKENVIPTAAGTGTVAAGSNTITGLSVIAGNFVIGQRVAGAGIPAGTTITAVGSGTLGLSAPATASGSAVLLNAKTTVSSISGQTITLSTNVNAAGAGLAFAGGPDNLTSLQCSVVATTGSGGPPSGGGAFSISNASVVPTPVPPPAVNNATAAANHPFISFNNATSGPVTAEVELPAGQQTFVIKTIGTGWTCAKHAPTGLEPAKATCTRSDALLPQASYPPFTVAIALGADAPDLSTVEATVSGGGAPTVSTVAQLPFDPPRPFAITAFETEVPDPEGNEETQAGAHPIQAKASFVFSRRRGVADNANSPLFVNHLAPVEKVKHINTHTPRGFVGNALAVPELCPSVEATLAEPTQCPEGSIVGGINLGLSGVGVRDAPIFSMKPEYGTPAQFVFPVASINGVYAFYPELRADDSYAISIISAPVPGTPELMEVDATLCGFGAKTRLTGSQTFFDGCKQPGEPGANPTPLVTLPTRCAGDPPSTELEIDSWQQPGQMISREFEAQLGTGCDQVDFEPTAEVRPLSNQADSPTGLDVELTLPTNGLEGKDDEGNLDPEALAQANMKTARVTFPEGMAINPSAGQGLWSCSAAQARMGANEPHACPDSSKIGTIEIDTPIIQETLTGAMYVGKQSEAPEESLIGLYLIFESKKDGIIIKVPGEVKTNPKTGQLVTTFDDILEDPFSRVQISFQQGPRASLLTPPRCGTYEVKAELVPWTVKDLDNPDPSEIVTNTTSFDVTQGPGGGPCPSGALEPKLSAGTTNPLAGQHTGFELGLSRNDGTQRINGLELSLPPGILGVLKGIPYCPEASIQAAMSRSDTGEGQVEIDSPSCPSASRIGSVSAGAGAGPNPIYVDTGKAYLAGPYKGAPLSLVVIAPAVAGPLDLGTVVVRNQLRIDRRTAQITAVSDPIPTILHGVLLDIRDVRMKIDRPNFVLNPTNCEAMSFNGQVSGESGAKAPVSDRFQLAGCENLGFKPRLSIHLKGGTKRGDHPSLLATLKARPGDANIARAAVTLPRSAFLDQAHIRTICTRVQFAAESCPPGAIYGSAEATTPLLDETLKGNVILRSSDNKLPDLVGTLNGIATVDVVGRIDSIKGGIRNTFDVVPDAPVDQFVLRMQGGKKGLVINSQDLCEKVSRATVRFTAQNGRTYNYRPVVVADGCQKAKKGRGKGGGANRGGPRR